MIELQITDEQAKYANRLIRSGSFANRGHDDGTPLEQFNGMIGETVVCDWLELPRPKYLGGQPDNGDFKINGLIGDIKTSTSISELHDGWIFSIIADQINRPCDFYLFVVHHPLNKTVTVIGAITKIDFQQQMFRINRGEPFRGYRAEKNNLCISYGFLFATYSRGDLKRFLDSYKWRFAK